MKGYAKDSNCVSERILTLDTLICGNDKYQFLQKTYIPEHDKMMEEMQRLESRLCISGYEVNAEDKNHNFIYFRRELKNENDKELKIRCYVSSDYKFYAETQVKPNISGSW